MRRSGSERRMSLFGRGNDACPICLTPFTKGRVKRGVDVTLEHVPPKALSSASRYICLTCGTCNERAGRGMEQAASILMHAPTATVEIKGVPHRAELDVGEDDIIDIRTAGLRVSPHVLHTLKPDEFQVRLKMPDPRFATISWLKAAYLSVFTLLGRRGYDYAAGTAVSLVREQIMHPEQRLIERFMSEVTDGPKRDWIFIHTKQPQFWMVKFDKWGIILPKADDGAIYADSVQLMGDKQFQLRDGHYFGISRFGESAVATATFDDMSKVEEIAGRDPFGARVRVKIEKTEVEWKYHVVAGRGHDYLTLLPVPSHG